VGTPEQCAEQLARFRAAGCGYFVMDAICDLADEAAQLETIARDVVPRPAIVDEMASPSMDGVLAEVPGLGALPTRQAQTRLALRPTHQR
jgi:hypothetical protein